MNSEIHQFSPFYTRIISEIISFIKCQKFDLTKFKSPLPVPVNNTVSNATSVAFPLNKRIFAFRKSVTNWEKTLYI